MRLFMLGVSVSAMLLLAGSAEASISFTSSAYDAATRPGQTMVETFDTPIASGYTFSGGAIETASVPYTAAAPAGDTSMYAAVLMGDAAVFTSSKYLQSASVYLGSLDDYNSISFLDNGHLVGAYSGSQLVANANGDQASALTNRTFDFTFTGERVNQIEFNSAGYSFEFDNIAVAPVPEASTWAYMIAGVGLIGGLVWSRRRKDLAGCRIGDLGLG